MIIRVARSLNTGDSFEEDGRTWRVFGRWNGNTLTASSSGTYDTFDAERLGGCSPISVSVPAQLSLLDAMGGGIGRWVTL